MGDAVDAISGGVSSVFDSAKDAVSSVTGAVRKAGSDIYSADKDLMSKLTNGVKKWGNASLHSFKTQLSSKNQAQKEFLQGQYGRAFRNDIVGDNKSTDQLVGGSTSKSDANTIIPLATAIVGAVNPIVGAGLSAARAYGQGASPLQSVKQGAIQYGSSYLGDQVGGDVGGATGSPVAGAAAGGFASGTTSGLAQGKGLNQSARQGLASGLTAGAVQGLNGSSDGSLTDSLTRSGESYVLNRGLSDALGVNQSGGVSTPATSNTSLALGANTSASPAGPANITGGAVDISGSDANNPRTNVWNKSSLRLKDALGA